HADPHAARPLHKVSESAARGLDLTRSDALRLQRLEAVMSERKRGAARGDAVNAALERLAKLGADRLQHDLSSTRFLRPPFHGGDDQLRLQQVSCPAPSDRARGFRP